MISSIQGILESLDSGCAYINVGGVTLEVHLPSSTLLQLGKTGARVKLHTHLHLKEDSLVLYGFASREELALFQALNTVSGIGPKTALSVLSAVSPEQLGSAVAAEDAALLGSIPGLGKKTAARLILELKGKIPAGPVSGQKPHVERDSEDILAALAALGYSPAEARTALSSLPPSPGLSLEEKLKLALQRISSR